MTIPLARPWLGEAEADAARATVLSGWVMQGPKVAEFEQQFAEYVGAGHACAVSSGTAALVLALKAVGVGHGDVVLTVSHSFIATANAIRACGAEPVFIDIEPAGYNMDVAALARLLADQCRRDGDGLWYKGVAGLLHLAESPLCTAKGPIGRVAAILAVHQMGIPCDITAIDGLAREYRIPWVEDAACAIGSEWQGERIGRPHGDAACFSFHPRKIITTGDGGMIVTNRPDIDEACRLWRQHGMVPAASGGLFETYACTAYNYRLTDIQAAIGLVQLGRLAEIVERRRERVAHYRTRLAGNPAFRIFPEPAGCRSNWQSLPLDFGGTGVDQGKLIHALAADGITAKPGIMNAHGEPPYGGLWELPESERRRTETILLPLFHDLELTDIERVAGVLKRFAVHG
jgi:dTDP-4-amino-4,6-dideoxygalactose transaminase